MIESGYYPPGAEFDPRAPYNEVENDEIDFDITCTQVLSKTVSVTTTNYVREVDEERDEEGSIHRDVTYDTSDTNWADEFAENEYHTPLQLIALFKRHLEDILNGTETCSKAPSYIKQLIKECEEWSEDETEFVRD